MNKHLKHILYLSIWTFTVVVVWIAVLVFLQVSDTKLSDEVLEAAEPIDPSFDTAALGDLERRVEVPVDLSSSAPEFDVVVEEDATSETDDDLP